jgi:hypothetical protein
VASARATSWWSENPPAAVDLGGGDGTPAARTAAGKSAGWRPTRAEQDATTINAEAGKGGHDAQPGEGHITSDGACTSWSPAGRAGCDSPARLEVGISHATDGDPGGTRRRPGSSAGWSRSAGGGGRSRSRCGRRVIEAVGTNRGQLGAVAGGFTGQLVEVDPHPCENLR